MGKISVKIKVSGIVQGVGFRPFIHKQVTDHSLCGWIRNTSFGAELKLEGEEAAIRRFLDELPEKKPALALIEAIEVEEDAWEGLTDFSIIASKGSAGRDTLISPDVCTCADCRRELLDPKDRRYHYPFINCTNCGPRFTIIRDIPYDRDKTTMADFAMCESCHREYTRITDRRYHAQPNCCPDCGPQLIFLDQDGRAVDGDPLSNALMALSEGQILAIKGLGGMHLACRADDPALAARLRSRKHRDEKPFALMCSDTEEAARYCIVTDASRALLESPARPIVLLPKRPDGPFGGDRGMHISENGRIGIMLPYTPVHILLMEEGPHTLIMTSANISDRPIISRNAEALKHLQGIADGFLLHNREIHVRCDDSVLWELHGRTYFARRSRGYVPYPLTMHLEAGEILACGAEQKATFSLSKGRHVFSSQHIGDLKNMETLDNFESQIRHFEKLFLIRPKQLVCDLHPDYLSTEYALSRARRDGISLLQVQHHYAHMASCMADNGLEEPVIGIIWDGTGLGTDGTAWGGEFLAGDYQGFTRFGSIRPLGLPGGDRAVREISRIGLALVWDLETSGMTGPDLSDLDPLGRVLFPHTDPVVLTACCQQLAAGVNCPATTSIGRLFDGVSAILGIREHTSYEGQGAILLEAAAADGIEEVLPYKIEATGSENVPVQMEESSDEYCPVRMEANSSGALSMHDETGAPLYRFDYRSMLREIIQRRLQFLGTPEESRVQAELAAAFMNTLVSMAADMAARIRECTGITKVVLSGGTFQNLYMLHRLCSRLENAGMTPYTHSRVSANDEGLSLGQLMIAAHRQSIAGGDLHS